MSIIKVALLSNQFPFLFQIAKVLDVIPSDLDSISITKGRKSLLERKAIQNTHEWGENCHKNYIKFFIIVDDKPIEIKSAGKYSNTCGKSDAWDAPRIEDQLFMLNLKTPRFIVECVRNYTFSVQDGITCNNKWTIYKMDEFNMYAHMAKKVDAAAASLKAEIAKACEK